MNKSAHYSMLSIIIVSKTPSTVTYSLAHGKPGRAFTWGATTGKDRMIIDQLEIGSKYVIHVEPDRAGTQHWVEAKKIVDERTNKPAKKKARSHAFDDLLVF